MPEYRRPALTDFRVNVEGVGEFTFARRTIRDEIACQREYARHLDGVEPTTWLQAVCGAMADIEVLTVAAPAGWDVDEMQPHDPDMYARLVAVHGGLLVQEAMFRQERASGGKGGGKDPREDDGVPVPAPVQPNEQ